MAPFANNFVEFFNLKLAQFYCVQYHEFFGKDTPLIRHIKINLTLDCYV
jgi:hypothetical protein